jgi:hypothetical protein
MTEAQAVVLLLALFGIKHFIVDFLLQKKYQYANKGTYGHPGGLLHAGLHGLGTFLILWPFAPLIWLIFMAVFDAALHYHIDWIKTNINRHFKWTAENDGFWWLLGADQLAHWLTYVIIIGWTIGAI